jgi:hypothetical protein
MLGYMGGKPYLYYMSLRKIQLVSLILFLIYTHRECRIRVTAIEAEPTPRTEFVNKPS